VGGAAAPSGLVDLNPPDAEMNAFLEYRGWTAGQRVPCRFRSCPRSFIASLLWLCILTLVLAGSVSAQTYTTRFRVDEPLLSESGSWTNRGLDWTTIRVQNGVAHGTQSGTNSGSAQYDDSYAHLIGFPPDQEAWGEVFIAKPDPGCNQEVEILLRWSSTPHATTGYECFARCLSNSGSYVQIVRWEGPLGQFTYLADQRGTDYGLKHGDILKASVRGNVISVYVNDVLKAQATDDHYKTGNPGIGEFLGCHGRRGFGSNTNFGFSSFTARAVTNAPAQRPSATPKSN
jgi:hypothetical protein